jgi:sterol desaturase/sphingolipid hydroxylase (fatty acid hydroxylase superfamily)
MGTDTKIRLGAFLAVFIAVAVCEARWPRRARSLARRRRWPANLAIIALNPLASRVVFPLLPAAMAAAAAQRHWGLLQLMDAAPWIKGVIAVVVLDLVVYFQHLLFHAVPTLWRLHMMHHADLDLDLTTGLRFHPVEIIISTGIKLVAVSAIGAPVTAVIIFEVVLNAAAMFNHSNWRIMPAVDRILRLLVVTPDMHRVHHSVIIRETNSNFGFNLSWWDRVFGTYQDQPLKGHTAMTIGLSRFRDPDRLTLLGLLAMPFTEDPGRVPINRH